MACNVFHLEQRLETAKPLRDGSAVKAVIDTQAFTPGNLIRMRADPIDGHHKDRSQLLISEKG